MTEVPPLSRSAFDELIREHQKMVRLANQLELSTYALGAHDPPSREDVAATQQAAGQLIGQLRQTLFRLDQEVYPILEPADPSD